MFSIKLRNDEKEKNKKNVCIGEITINSFVESFEVSLSYWKRKDYEPQWYQGLERILKGEERTCLITNMHDPKTANFIFWWVLYHEKDKIIVQNQLIFLDQLTEKFDENNPYKHLGKYTNRTEDNEPISEWICSVKDIKFFLDKTKGK